MTTKQAKDPVATLQELRVYDGLKAVEIVVQLLSQYPDDALVFYESLSALYRIVVVSGSTIPISVSDALRASALILCGPAWSG